MVKFHKSVHYTVLQCKICYQAWPQKSRKQLSKYVCLACSRDKQDPKRFSKENNMIPSPIPKELQALTQIEEMLIARALPPMRVYVKPGGQRGYSGHIINLPQDITWPEIADNATAHAREYLAIWPPYTLRKRMAEIKQNENRTTSGLPGTSAVIRSSS